MGNVGQNLVESIFSFVQYKPIPVTQLVRSSLMNPDSNQEGFVNFGWRGWEGALAYTKARQIVNLMILVLSKPIIILGLYPLFMLLWGQT